MTEPLELTETGIKVGPNPDPEPPEPVTLVVEFTLSDGSTEAQVFTIPPEKYATSMELRMHRGPKNLGPILRSHFWFHNDSRQLHTICRRESRESPGIEELDGPPPGPEIDIVEY